MNKRMGKRFRSVMSNFLYALRCTRNCSDAEEIEARHISRAIDKELKKDKPYIKNQMKVLLLGAGETGKSTFMKQMQIIYKGEFDKQKIKEYRDIIYQNIIRGMKILVEAKDKLNIPWENPSHEEDGDEMRELKVFCESDPRLFVTYVPSLNRLWKDAGIRKAYERRREFQLNDCVKYFLENLERISKLDYMPSNDDILHSRKATNGVVELPVFINHVVPITFIDVGGQRTERGKWLQCFDSVTSILFLVSAAEFDQVLAEDRVTNRLVESRCVFETIINNGMLKEVSMVLFLNKTDLLEEKVMNKQADINHYFSKFKGDPWNIEDVKNFLVNFFIETKRDPKKKLYHHFTTAVNTENIENVFNAVKNTILCNNLNQVVLS